MRRSLRIFGCAISSFLRIGLALPAALAFAVAGASGEPAVVPGIPAITVTYSPDCTFTMTIDPATTVTSPAAPGPTVPPGVYQLVVLMPNPTGGYVNCAKPTFTFTGPGVSVQVVFAGQELDDERVLPSLPPSSTYVAEDESAPGSTRKVFSTAAAGSSTGVPATTTKHTTPKPSVQPDIVGSAVAVYRGRLIATVSASGIASLEHDGRSFRSLKAGNYDISVDDAATRAGFFLERSGGKAIEVTSLAFHGKRTRRVTLTAGTWSFSSKIGKPKSFTAVGQ